MLQSWYHKLFSLDALLQDALERLPPHYLALHRSLDVLLKEVSVALQDGSSFLV